MCNKDNILFSNRVLENNITTFRVFYFNKSGNEEYKLSSCRIKPLAVKVSLFILLTE